MTKQRIDKRKALLLLLPVLLAFAAFAFYTLGGGKTETRQAAATHGLNLILPGAQLKKDAPKDKMGIYDLTKKDSAHQDNGVRDIAGKMGFTPAPDPQAKQISEKLAAINKVINTPVVTPKSYAEPVTKPESSNGDVDRLEKLMKSMQQTNGKDPEMTQLNTLMDKILDVQNPGSAAAKRAKNEHTKPDSSFKAIPAIIDGGQKVLQGGIVRLRLEDTIRVKGLWIPKGQLLFGNAQITNQRLLLIIKDIRLGNSIIPVDFMVYSLDGLPGINAPDAELAGAAGNGADNALQSMQFLSMDQSLGTQAAEGGIEAAKTLFGKKVRRVKVKLKGGYPLLLRIAQWK